MALDKNRLVEAFTELRRCGRKTLAPFLTAGFPSLEVTEALLASFDAMGLKVCELGFPFTDPIADGPVIQASYTEALAAGVTSAKIFDTVRSFRAAGGKLALVAMVSYSIVYRHGVEAFVKGACEAGFDGFIIPDLPLEESSDTERIATDAGAALVQLIAPTTSEARRVEIARHARGFIYYMSVAGVTGERTALPAATIEGVAELRTHTDTPICVGFGVSNPETVASVCTVADAAIVGSAIVRRLAEMKNESPAAIVAAASAFVKELAAPLM